jgi:putative CocE/NonD family hydrolase
MGGGGADESTDAYDTIDWVVKNVPGNNGRVGIVGLSYPGFYAACGMVGAHPALKCAVPQAPVGDWFVGDDIHRNGAFNFAASYLFLRGFGDRKPEAIVTPDGYRYFLSLGAAGNAVHLDGSVGFWDEIMAHGAYDDYWKARAIGPHLSHVHVAVMNVGGWFDAEDLYGTLSTYRQVEGRNPGITNVLVMGPWSHGGWGKAGGESLGDVHFGAETADWYRRAVELPFLKDYLTGDGRSPGVAEATVFETGVNEWRRFGEWPPRGAVGRELYLRGGGTLSFDKPSAGEGAFDEYVSDPARPVPYVSGIELDPGKKYMVADQRFAAERPDVLVYESGVLKEDLRVVGPIGVDLKVSTTGTDADWVVKVIDVYPDDTKDPSPNPAGVRMGGYQQLVRGDIMRGKFREGLDRPVPFEPGKVASVDFDMPDVCHTFRRGHRVMVQVQSSWFPLFDRNPQTFCDIYHARPGDYRKATQRVYHSPGNESVLRLKVLPDGSAE